VAQELEYDINLPALSREVIEAEAEDGRKALITEHGDKWWASLAKEFSLLTTNALPSLLSKKFPTIESALVDGVPSNAISRALNKASVFERCLPKLCPGTVIWIGSGNETGKEDQHEYDRMYVTGLKVPAYNRLSLAGWKVVGWSEQKRKRIEVSVASVVKNMTPVNVEGYLDHTFVSSKKEAAEHVRWHKGACDRFFTRNAQPYEGVSTRVILTGNLYRAAELADSLNSGQTVTYSDAKGVWHHGVLMPTNMSIRRVGMLPVICTDADMVMDAANHIDAMLTAERAAKEEARKLKAEKSDLLSSYDTDDFSWHFRGGDCRISDTFKTSLTSSGQVPHSYILKVWPHAAEISLVNGKSLRDAMANSKEITALLASGWDNKDRDRLVGVSAPGKTREFVEAVLQFLESRSAKALMDGDMREWYNDYMSKKTGLVNTAAQTVEEALKEDAADELGALMATP